MIHTSDFAPARDEAGSSFAGPAARASGGLLALGIAGVLLLTAACWPMQRHALPTWAAATLAAGLLAWLAVAWKSAGVPEPLPEIAPAPANVNRLATALLAALALAALSWTRTASGQFEMVGVASWLGAVVIWLWGWSRRAFTKRLATRGPRHRPPPALGWPWASPSSPFSPSVRSSGSTTSPEFPRIPEAIMPRTS